jgi:peptidoglycan/xylan/chitin deacetylase (PgdA/CDA1 family)
MEVVRKFPGFGMFDFITEKLFAHGQAIRRWPQEERVVYLTFDDGPDEVVTL